MTEPLLRERRELLADRRGTHAERFSDRGRLRRRPTDTAGDQPTTQFDGNNPRALIGANGRMPDVPPGSTPADSPSRQTRVIP
jgi:hypothetical protein